jgi:hypothetical protein
VTTMVGRRVTISQEAMSDGALTSQLNWLVL